MLHFKNVCYYFGHRLKMTAKSKIMRKAHRPINSLVIIALGSLYVLGSTDLKFFHHLVHRHEATELHTAQEESDPCHVALHHPERGADCGHKAHLVKEDRCPLCHAQFVNTQVVTPCVLLLAPAFYVVSYHHSFGEHTVE